MHGELAQLVAITCHGNAILAGLETPPFFPGNSTCQFCDSICFVELQHNWFGRRTEKQIAATVDEWFSQIRRTGFAGLRLRRQAQNDPRFPDRLSAGFVGGGGTWVLEAVHSQERTESWVSQWSVWNREAPENRIWRVKYGLVNRGPTVLTKTVEFGASITKFERALELIREFSDRHDLSYYSEQFSVAQTALRDPEADIGFHRDLAVSGQLPAEAVSLLKASMSAWVFGGMGSWNDMAFDEPEQQEYERVSESLWHAINLAIEVAANSSTPHG